jgi:hypothetical protein
MTRQFETLRTYIAAAIVLASLTALGVDLAQTAYTAAHTARTVILATAV